MDVDSFASFDATFLEKKTMQHFWNCHLRKKYLLDHCNRIHELDFLKIQ